MKNFNVPLYEEYVISTLIIYSSSYSCLLLFCLFFCLLGMSGQANGSVGCGLLFCLSFCVLLECRRFGVSPMVAWLPACDRKNGFIEFQKVGVNGMKICM